MFVREGAKVVVADMLEHEGRRWPMRLAPRRGSSLLM
jgi:hypothetical protein